MMRPFSTENASQHRAVSALRDPAAHFKINGYSCEHTVITLKITVLTNSVKDEKVNLKKLL